MMTAGSASIIASFLFWSTSLAHRGRCGTRRTSVRELKNSESLARRRLLMNIPCDDLCDGCIHVVTAFHPLGVELDIYRNGTLYPVIPHPSWAMEAFLSNDRTANLTLDDFTTMEELQVLVDAQVDVINDSFLDTPFRFNGTLLELAVFPLEYVRFSLDHDVAISSKIGLTSASVLNVFLAYGADSVKDDDSGVTLGFATGPAQNLISLGDGVFQRYDVLPFGGSVGTDTGLTLTHEIGHWLGLLHVYDPIDLSNPEGYYEGETCVETNANDLIDDTPVVAASADVLVEDCQALLEDGAKPVDSCPNLPGVDPIFNYMNNVDHDFCWIQAGYFTCNQIERMYRQWLLYRDPSPENCTEGEMFVEFVMKLDGEYHFVDNYFYLADSQGKTIWNSTTDHLDFDVYDDDSTSVTDMCLESDVNYTFYFHDRFGDGFSGARDSYIRVLVDQMEIAMVEGNFGRFVSIHIPSGNVTTSAAERWLTHTSASSILLTFLLFWQVR